MISALKEMLSQKLCEMLEFEKIKTARGLLCTEESSNQGRNYQPVISPEVAKGHRRRALKISMQDKRQKLTDLQSKAVKAREPQKMHDKLNIARQKLSLDMAKFKAIK